MSTETTPAANAVRHGLSGTRHVLPEHRELVKQIEQEFVDIFKPECPDEQELLAEMALHKFRVGEIDRQQLIRDGLLKSKAEEIAETQARKKFETLLKKLEDDPHNNINSFKLNHLGAAFAAHAWEKLAEATAPDGGGVTIEMAWAAVMVEGRSPHVLHTTGPGGWLMGRVLAVSADPESAIENWLAKSDSRNSKTGASRARTFLQVSTDAGIARSQLHERAVEKSKFWHELAQSLSREFAQYKHDLAETMESGDDQLDRDTRLADRYRTKSQNQLNALQRRFDNQRAAKLKHFRWTHEIHAKEQQHKENLEVRASALSRSGIARYSEMREREFAGGSRNSYAQSSSTQPVEYKFGDQTGFLGDDTDDANDIDMLVQDSESAEAADFPLDSFKNRGELNAREKDRAGLRHLLRTLDGGKWLERMEKIKSNTIDLLMLRDWPEKITVDHAAAFGEMLTERETDQERKKQLAIIVVTNAKYKQVMAEVEKEQEERRKAGPKMKNGRFVFPLMSDLEDEIERRMGE